MKRKPLILVTNDDGIAAPGIKTLVEIAREIGEVVIVAPDSPQSAKGHAITISSPIRLREVDVFEGLTAYECSGTPVDCVKLAKFVVLKERQVDLCISGINHGSNASINILYSGTVSAAMEASLEGINSIAFSLLDFSWEADFEPAKTYIRKILQQVLKKGMPEDCKLLSINIPKLPFDKIKGIKVCRQAEGRWEEEFHEAKDPQGVPYYWLTGEFRLDEDKEDNDIWALEQGYISVVPSGHDLTVHQALGKLRYLETETD
ncbi:MAG: 5'/3'-nucleotidase SurE [Bacteroidota bacterium]